MTWDNFAEGDSGVPMNNNAALNDEQLRDAKTYSEAKRDRRLYVKAIAALIKLSDDTSNPYELRKTAFDFAHDLWFTTHAVHP